ncbi:PREDICTED: uncharacterized protein LOC105572750 isoform X2 [Cercocebus atys]|uniref:uncharacterized protein LOC105572750 isoform X2 n=1 Tax=Cercocebus atys TaxID=9531 RepID=UPI0005F44C17|nr:PREDICTED: uncharacterized protein LOC105572750 isoform X2 [Cercocebus atys]
MPPGHLLEWGGPALEDCHLRHHVLFAGSPAGGLRPPEPGLHAALQPAQHSQAPRRGAFPLSAGVCDWEQPKRKPGDLKKPSKKHVKREPCSTTTVTSSSTINEILRRYSLYTTQRRRHHGFWGKKKVHPQEASEESPALKDRGDGDRPVNTRVMQVVPLRCDSTPYGDPVQDIANEDAVRDIANDTVRNICNEDALYEITNEAAVHNTNQHAVQDICKKDAAKEPFILENDLIVESISDDEDFAA